MCASLCSVTDGRWFGKASDPGVADMAWTTSFEHDSPSPRSHLASSSSSGSLACPPDVLMPLGELSGDISFGDIDPVPLDDAHAHEANQAPTQWCESTGVIESLVSTRFFVDI